METERAEKSDTDESLNKLTEIKHVTYQKSHFSKTKKLEE